VVDSVTIRDLRNKGGEVIDRVAAGRPLTVTRDGRAVAELRPVRVSGLSAAVLLERWRHVPIVDGPTLRRDIDRVIDQRL
jgi:prevent-host-death family protein